jgi:hypothetical protein
MDILSNIHACIPLNMVAFWHGYLSAYRAYVEARSEPMNFEIGSLVRFKGTIGLGYLQALCFLLLPRVSAFWLAGW